MELSVAHLPDLDDAVADDAEHQVEPDVREQTPRGRHAEHAQHLDLLRAVCGRREEKKRT